MNKYEITEDQLDEMMVIMTDLVYKMEEEDIEKLRYDILQSQLKLSTILSDVKNDLEVASMVNTLVSLVAVIGKQRGYA